MTGKRNLVITQSSAGNSAAVEYLEKLARALHDSELSTHVMSRIGRSPFLRVTNPKTAQLSEDVTYADGHWWWSWGEPLAPTGDIERAVARITRVLHARD